MNVVACEAPSCLLEPAPLTSLPLASMLGNKDVSAFWGDDERYYVRAVEPSDAEAVASWYQIDAGVSEVETNLDERLEIARLMADIIPMGGGRVAFPVGSTGRRFYRVWRSGSAESGSRTRILEVRAARSRRLPA